MRFRIRYRTKRQWGQLAVVYAVFALPMAFIGYQSTKGILADSLTDGQVQLSLNKSQYKVGDTVVYTITNGMQNTISIPNHCPNEPLTVSRWEANQWMVIHAARASALACTHQPKSYAIDPGKSVTSTYDYWRDMFSKPGKYRVAVPVNGLSNLPAQEFIVAQ